MLLAPGVVRRKMPIASHTNEVYQQETNMPYQQGNAYQQETNMPYQAQSEPVVVGIPVGHATGTVPATLVTNPGYVACTSTDKTLRGAMCNAQSQFVCRQCNRPMCMKHRRFWAGQLICNLCQEPIVQNDGAVMCCVAQ